MIEFKESKFYKLLQDFFITNNKETFIHMLAEFYNRTEGILEKDENQDELIKELRDLYIEFNEKGIDENIVIEKVNYFVENNVKIKDILAKLVINTNKIENITTQLDKTTNNLIKENKISNNLFDLGFLHWNKRQENNTKTSIYIMKNDTDNIISLETNNTVNYLYQTFNIPNGHNIYVGFQAKCISSSNTIGFSLRQADGKNPTNLEIDTTNNEWQFISGTKISNGEMALYTALSLTTHTTSNFHFKNIIVLDLTELGITKEKADLLVKTWFENSFLNKDLSYVLNRAKNNGYIDAIECGCSTIIENAEKNTLLMKSLLASGVPIKINCIIPINDTLDIDSNSSNIIGNGINTSGLTIISNNKKL